jgi:3-hydroxyphenylacetate 6-hydroxylase
MISILIHLLHNELTQHTFRSMFLLLVALPTLHLFLGELHRRSTRLKDFSGPPNWPVVGNIPDIKYNAAEKYREWSKIYGDVYQIQLGIVPVVVVNSAEAAKKIFGGHSQALSSRPVFWTFHKVRYLA